MPATKTSKELILRKSLQVFWEKGYHHASISDLAAACQIEKPHFYYYFKDKKTLMLEVLQYAHLIIRNKILSVAYQDTLSAAERLDMMMDTTISFYKDAQHGCLMANTIKDSMALDSSFKPLLQDFFEEWIASLRFLYLEKYSEKEARKIAVQDYQLLQGSILFTRLYNDLQYLIDATHLIKKRLQ